VELKRKFFCFGDEAETKGQLKRCKAWKVN